MKKRGLAGLLALALILALAACGGTEAQEDAAQDQKMEEAAPPQEEETSETDGEDGVPVTIEGPETADDSQQLQEDEPDLGSRPADQAKEPETGSRPADPAEKPVYQPVEDTKPQQPDKEPETPAQPAPAPPAESASGVDLADFCASVTGDQETWPALMAVEGETLDTFYAGLSTIATQQCLVQMAMISASGDEIALVEVENSGDVQAVKDIFQARIDYQVGDGTSPGGAWYPAPTEMWRNESRIVSNGNFVMLVAHTGADAVVEQFNALFD